MHALGSLDKLLHYSTELLLGQVRRENLRLMFLADVGDTTQATGQVHYPVEEGGRGRGRGRRGVN